MRKPVLLALVTVALSACGVVRKVSVRPDYETEDKTRTVRLAVHTQPPTEGGETVTALWNRMARRYTNDHRDFIVKAELPASWSRTQGCPQGIEGVLQFTPKLTRREGGLEAWLDASLVRCRDGEPIWTAQAGGSFASEDAQLQETVSHYTAELGPDSAPFVAPSFRILREVLETLPKPKLPDDEAVMEKIEAGN
jgi:probable lipoprotein (TIGR04455 family)